MHLVSVVNKQGRGYIRDRSHHDKMQRIAAICSNRQLQQTLQAGIAFHNAGMGAAERAQVEELFMERDVLVSKKTAFSTFFVCCSAVIFAANCLQCNAICSADLHFVSTGPLQCPAKQIQPIKVIIGHAAHIQANCLCMLYATVHT